ncbi:MAG: PKD domain-containing protein [Candidatus Symbiothrix sp.]|jgi:hypothetical protein|nr:PKD domain-containing protein [Candidatus Symbiothrix sp.]
MNTRICILLFSLTICFAAIFALRSCLSSRRITASVYPLEIEQGTPISFADSTKGADSWIWEWGNGDIFYGKSGSYLYQTAGKYQIRLKVDGKLEKKFILNVHPKGTDAYDNLLVKISAPSTGIQNEYITFRGEGASKEWRWEFGETGLVDAREKTAIYKYSEPGAYEVLLSTEETYYPVRHSILIDPAYTDDDTLNVETMIGNDIKEKLQAIVDQDAFNVNYNYILDNYLCNNPNIPVMINNSRKNDFYSYCQGLKLIGRKRTSIENVLIDMDEDDTYCIVKLIVIQTENDNRELKNKEE